MYFRGRETPRFPKTTSTVKMDFKEWYQLAMKAESSELEAESTHFYFESGGNAGDFIFHDFPIFTTKEPNFFISAPQYNKGIQCRFGMRGVIAATHYDSGRNMVAMVQGAKRYILNPPNECKKLGIISEKAHPSFRHSTIDWSNMEEAKAHNFDTVDGIDTIVRQGEVLYIPSFWFHYIISLEYSAQCNSRSGFPPKMQGKAYIEDCMDMSIKSNLRNGH